MNHDWDELASAYLDGEATEEEIALVEGTPAAMAIVDEFRAIASATASVPAPGAALEQQQITKALDLFDELAGPAVESANGPVPVDAASAPTKVIDLAARRRRRNGWLSAAAAGVTVVAGFGIASLALGGGQDESATDSAEVAASPSAADTEAATDDGRAAALAAPTAADAAAADAAAGDDGAMEDSELAEGAEDAMEEEADEVAPTETTTSAPAQIVPFLELESGQDLFTVIDELEANGVFGDPSLHSNEQLSLIEERCPTELAELTEPIGISVLFDGADAQLVYDPSTPELPDRVVIITSTCSILAADQRP